MPVNALLAFVIPCLPLAGAAALFLPGLRAPARAVAPWIPATGLLLTLVHGTVVEFSWLLLGARVGLDRLGLPLVVLASVAWTLAGLYAARNLAEADKPRFFVFWLLTWTGNLCVFLTLDAASFYAAYATMTFSAYGLVVFTARPADFRAGRVYLIMALAGEAMILTALLLLASGAGNAALENGEAGAAVAALPEAGWVAALFIGGFAVKMGIVPLHMWLPVAHPQAPPPASAVLSGVILKAGLMGWLRFLPLGAPGFDGLGMLLAGAGVATAFFGVAAGLPQSRAKTLLAYSSVSQMGLVAVAVGMALAYPAHAALLSLIAVIFAVHHGLAKAALFLAVDLAQRAPRLVRALMWLPALAIAGGPLTTGAMAKTLLKSALPEQAGWLEPTLVASSVATTLLMARFLYLAWPAPQRFRADAPGLEWLALVVAGVTAPWALAIAAGMDAAGSVADLHHVLGASWPVAAGLAAALAGGALWRGGAPIRVPEGDLIVLFARAPRPPAPPVPVPVKWPTIPPRWTEASEHLLARLGPALGVWLAVAAAIFVLGQAWPFGG